MRLAMRPEIRAIGWMTDGTPIYPIWGADPDPDKEGEEDGNSSGESEDSGEGTGGGTAETSAVDVAQLAIELETTKRRLAAADAAKGQAEKRLNEIDSKDKSELEKAQEELRKATARADAAEAAALRAKLDREILKFPGFVWHDPETVLALVDMEMISVTDDGKVEGVKQALEKLSKSKPFLLKGKTDNNKSNSGGGTNGPSGQNPTGGGETDKNKVRDKLAQKYKLR